MNSESTDVRITLPCKCQVTFVAGSPNHCQLTKACITHQKFSVIDQMRLLLDAEKGYKEFLAKRLK